jgi:hypothetical protein
MEFILQLIADLLIPEEIGKQNESTESIAAHEVSEEVVVANEEVTESPNIFGLMEFH